MVEQLGLAMMRSSIFNSCPLISGTINFLVGSIRQAEELSITMVPFSAYLGRYAPPPLLRRMVSAGYLGRKNGVGFYDWRGKDPVPMELGL